MYSSVSQFVVQSDLSSALMWGRHGIDNPRPNSHLVLECSVCFLVGRSLLSIMFSLDQCWTELAQHTLSSKDPWACWVVEIQSVITVIIDNLLYIIADNLATKFVFHLCLFLILKMNHCIFYLKNPEPFTEYCHRETKSTRAHSTKVNISKDFLVMANLLVTTLALLASWNLWLEYKW